MGHGNAEKWLFGCLCGCGSLVWLTGYWRPGELEVEAAAFEHDQGDEVAEVPVAVAHLDGGLDLVVDGLQASVG